MRFVRAFASSIVALASALTATAQTATISGRVVSDAGQPLAGATVVIDAMMISVETNSEGLYSIVIPAARVQGQAVTLLARAIGYRPVWRTSVVSAGVQRFDFEMKTDVNRLNQVVVTGVAGATEVKKLAFTVTRLTPEDMPVAGFDPINQIQGKVAGASIISVGRARGMAQSILLRGPQSINAGQRGQAPLLIVDGVVSNGTVTDFSPQDIETIEVVKGAAASSIYGSRAGNGVIQITTRSGKTAREGVQLRATVEYGQSDIERILPIPKSHIMLMNEDMTRFCVVTSGVPDCSRTVDIDAELYRVNDQGGDYALTPATLANDFGLLRAPSGQTLRSLFMVNPYPRVGTPMRQALAPGETYNTTLDATGKVGHTNFYASVNQYRQHGTIRYMDPYVRNTVRLNVDHQMPGNWNFGLRTFYADVVDNVFAYNLPFLYLARQPANAMLLRRDSKGRLFVRSAAQSFGAGYHNPLYQTEQFRPRDVIGRFTAALIANWQPLPWLDAQADLGIDSRNNFQRSQGDRGYRTPTQNASMNQGWLDWGAARSSALNGGVRVTARRSWLEDALDSRMTFRALYEGSSAISSGWGGTNLAVPGLETPGAVVQGQYVSGSTQQVRALGMFGTIDLDYKGRYIVGTLIRRDAASLFGAAERWQTYGRGSLAWRISEEPWFAFGRISDLKLRASLGTAGNRPNFNAQYETFTISTGGGLSASTMGNRHLRPEVSRELELGADLEVMNRYALTVAHARNVIDDQLLPVSASAASGYTSQWRNAGEVTNKTWEVSLHVPLIARRDLQYSMRVLYDATRSVISRLDVPEYFTDTWMKISQGDEIGAMWGRFYVNRCEQLPAAFASRCGPGLDYQTNSDGLIVYVGAGNTVADGITKNLWMTRIPAADAPWGGGTTKDPLSWGLPIVWRDSTGTAAVRKLGHSLPDVHWSLAQRFNWKRLTAYALLDAIVGRSVYSQPRLMSMGDFQAQAVDMMGKSVGEAKPIGYFWRPVSAGGIGGLYEAMNSYVIEDGSFVKLRELSVAYHVGALSSVPGDWTVSVVGRNLRTWTKYSGYDPEVGSPGTSGSNVLMAVDTAEFPNPRTITCAIGIRF